MSDMEAQRAHDPVNVTDRELADAVIDTGDEVAFRQLYRRHTPRLLGFVQRLLGPNDAEAEDAVQETWIRACQSLARFRWDSSFSTWLGGIGLNVVRDRIRKQARSRIVDFEQLPERPVAPASTEDRIDLERAIALLPDGYRIVLVLHDVEGMKHREIAERLGISDGTSKSQLSNARRMLREILTPPDGVEP
jgi:RNA polymerase sigma-70 factor (ECF subfamily)